MIRRLRKLRPEAGEATAETRAIVDKANDEITELRKQITDLETKMNRPKLGRGWKSD